MSSDTFARLTCGAMDIAVAIVFAGLAVALPALFWSIRDAP
jgi:hypothetical protein